MPIALITGGSAGLGHAFAHQLASDGYDLVLVARNADRLRGVAEGLRIQFDVAVEVIAADLARPASRAGVERRLARRGEGAVDLLVNNAGCEVYKEFGAAAPEELQAEVDLNISAVMQLTRAALPAMIDRANGAVINVASFAGYLPARGSAYGASKAWVLAFTDTVAASLVGTDVRAIALCAGRLRRPGAERQRGPLWLDAEDVVAQCLSDLRRGRVMCTPGWLYRGLVGVLESPRRTLRLLARVAGRSRSQNQAIRPSAARSRIRRERNQD